MNETKSDINSWKRHRVLHGFRHTGLFGNNLYSHKKASPKTTNTTPAPKRFFKVVIARCFCVFTVWIDTFNVSAIS